MSRSTLRQIAAVVLFAALGILAGWLVGAYHSTPKPVASIAPIHELQ